MQRKVHETKPKIERARTAAVRVLVNHVFPCTTFALTVCRVEKRNGK